MRSRIFGLSLSLTGIKPGVVANISTSLDSHLSTAMMDEIANLLYGFENSPENENSNLVVKQLKAYYYVLNILSPYAEVRASVPNTDDPTMPVDTFRTWFLGIFFCILFSSLNQVSSHH